MAEKYFAGYVDSRATAPESIDTSSRSPTDENVLGDEQLFKILVDDDTEKTVTSGTPSEAGRGL